MAKSARNNGLASGRRPKSVPPVEHQFKPGNPGRPVGSRNKLGEAFVKAMYADFEEHGVAVIAKVRADKPDQYLKVIASLLPQELHVKDATLDDMTDDELIEILAALRHANASGGRKARNGGIAEADSEAGSGETRRIN